MNQLGRVFHADSRDGSPSATSVAGRCVAAASFAAAVGKSAANGPRNSDCFTYRSLPPPASGTGGASAAPSVAPGNLPDRASALSPGSGADAATNTSALTLSLPTAALLITEPP